MRKSLIHIIFIFTLIFSGGAAHAQFTNTKSLRIDPASENLLKLTKDITLLSSTSSLSFWIKFNSLGTWCLLSSYYNSRAVWGDNTPRLNFETSVGTYSFDLPAITTGLWFHFVVTRSGDNVRVYVNGSESLTGLVALTGTLSFGQATRYRAVANTTINGWVDEISLWDVTLSQAAITDLYNTGTPIDLKTNTTNYTQSANLVHWWRMGDGTENSSGITIYDMSGHASKQNMYMINMSNASYVTDVP